MNTVKMAVIFVGFVWLFLGGTPEGARRAGSCFSLNLKSKSVRRTTKDPEHSGSETKGQGKTAARPVLLDWNLIFRHPLLLPWDLEVNNSSCKIMKSSAKKENQSRIDNLNEAGEERPRCAFEIFALSNLTFKTYFLLFAFLNSRKIYTHK
jgi:hypothetical protein